MISSCPARKAGDAEHFAHGFTHASDTLVESHDWFRREESGNVVRTVTRYLRSLRAVLALSGNRMRLLCLSFFSYCRFEMRSSEVRRRRNIVLFSSTTQAACLAVRKRGTVDARERAGAWDTATLLGAASTSLSLNCFNSCPDARLVSHLRFRPFPLPSLPSQTPQDNQYRHRSCACRGKSASQYPSFQVSPRDGTQSAYSSTSQRGNAATPRPLATICNMMSVVSITLWRFGTMFAGVRNCVYISSRSVRRDT